MSNLSISISFVIGGLLIISILTLNGRVIQNSGETVLNMTAKQTIENVSGIMRLDFQRMGYNMNDGIDDAIQSFDGKSITFLADIDDDESSKATSITWEFTNTQYTASSNPNDYELVRTGPIDGTVTTSRFPVVYNNFAEPNFIYLDTDEDTLSPGSDPASQIRSVYVRLETQSPTTYGEDNYTLSFWNKTFAPAYLNLKDIFQGSN